MKPWQAISPLCYRFARAARRGFAIALGCTVLSFAAPCLHFPAYGQQPAEPLPQLEEAAKIVQQTTVTVRLIVQVDANGRPIPAVEAGENRPQEPAPVDGEKGPQPPEAVPGQEEPNPPARRNSYRVLVCSGVSLGNGLVVTSLGPSPGGDIRITLPGGEQAEAHLRVVDHYTGLSLLHVPGKELPSIALADQPPAVGAWIIGGAGWGIEKPLVSLGLVAATDRSLPGTTLPPLIQCDMRAAQTSSGAPLVDRHGKLLGIVVASDAPNQRNAWTYAVTASHVQRLIRAQVEGKLVVLRRRRPVVGLVLGPGEEADTVVVERVEPGGPAEKAGLREGDQIIAADGLKIRSVYQVLGPVIQRQPGDQLVLTVLRGANLQGFNITLGGGAELPEGNLLPPGEWLVDRRIAVDRDAQGRLNIRGGEQGHVRNLDFAPEDPAARPNNNAQGAETGEPARQPPFADDPIAKANEERIALLERAIAQYGVVITRLQEEIRRRDQQLTEGDRQLEELRKELETLRGALQEAMDRP